MCVVGRKKVAGELGLGAIMWNLACCLRRLVEVERALAADLGDRSRQRHRGAQSRVGATLLRLLLLLLLLLLLVVGLLLGRRQRARALAGRRAGGVHRGAGSSLNRAVLG